MTENFTNQADTGVPTVEDRWIDILREEIGEEPAKELTMSVFASPRLTIDDPDPDEVPNIVAETLQSLHDEERIDTDIIEQYEEELLQAVTEECTQEEKVATQATRNDGASTDVSPYDLGDGQSRSDTDSPISENHQPTDQMTADAETDSADSQAGFTAQSETTTRSQAPAQTAALGATAQNTEVGQSQSPGDDIDGEIDIDEAIAGYVVGYMQEETDVELTDEVAEKAAVAAANAVNQYRIRARDKLYPGLSDRERELAYEWLIDRHVRKSL